MGELRIGRKITEQTWKRLRDGRWYKVVAMQTTEQTSRLDQMLPQDHFRECHHLTQGAEGPISLEW